ncbi:unnamed protein product [Anisakis simplex]|uniref:AP-3 complex subunit delta-1 (inferred by orthology to a human protein) n=1 Tax=Anisakis simplex TaxID=6269 RepID=A0A158PP47_ANISI|nr:unnamed protein product [Anisakis simplex]
MALRKVRSNIDRLFDKSLTDLIRGIRNNKDNEARYISSCIEEIKMELRQESTYVKANAIEKLVYLQMLGYDISWASFNIIEVMASTKYTEKRIGYLSGSQCFNESTDVLMLTTNMIRKDLHSANIYDISVTLNALSCFVTVDLARDLCNDIINLLCSSRPYIRKRAVLLLYKIFLKYPDSLKPTFVRLKERLEDSDPGVQSAAVNVICELARKNPKNYVTLAPVFFKLMTASSNNWMLIKIIKLFGALVPLEPRLGKKLLEPLTNLINSTSAMSLLYECINTVIAVLISVSSDAPGDHTASIQLCVQKLGVLIEDSDQNLKYLGLLAMGKILKTHPKAVQAHKDIVLRCLDDRDESIRLRALDLLYGMVSKKNIMEIIRKLMEHVDRSEGSYYRDELLARIISICSYNNYQYISVLVELTKVEGSKHGAMIAEQTKISGMPGHILSVYIQNISKLYSVIITKYEMDNEWEGIESIDNLLLSKLPEFQLSDHLEAQERACTLMALITIIEEMHSKKEKVSEDYSRLFDGELNPVAVKAQRKVPVPEGLNLDDVINEESEVESVYGEEEEEHFKPNISCEDDHSYRDEVKYDKGVDQHQMQMRIKQRQYEIENNPYYMKSIDKNKVIISDNNKKVNELLIISNNKSNDIKKPSKNVTSMHNYNHPSLDLQSPLEIPGVVGLDRYMQQQQSTLSWKSAKKDKNKKLKSKKEVISSSDDDDIPIIHQVNRSEGDMPENAKSTDDETNSDINDEMNAVYKALDVDLNDSIGINNKKLNSINKEQNIGDKSFKKRSSNTRKTKIKREKREKGEEKRIKKVKSKKDEVNLISGNNGVFDQQPPKKKSAKKSKETVSKQSSRRSNDAHANVDAPIDKDVYEATSGVCTPSYHHAAVDVFSEDNNHLLLSLHSSGSEHNNNSLIRHHQQQQHFKFVADNLFLKLRPIRMPFELNSANEEGEYAFRFIINTISTPQKLKGTVTFFVQKNDEETSEDKLDFKINLPTLTFLMPATIGCDAFEVLITSGDVDFKSSIQFEIDLRWKHLLSKIISCAHFSVVEEHDCCVSLYAHTIKAEPVCVIVKQQVIIY